MAKIKVKLLDAQTLVLEEDGKKGDIIKLDEAMRLDMQNINRLIAEGKDQVYQNIRHQDEKKHELILQQELLKVTTDFQKKIIALENTKDNEIRLLKANLEQLKTRQELIIKDEVAAFKADSEYSFLQKITSLENELAQKQTLFQMEKDNLTLKNENKLKDLESQLAQKQSFFELEKARLTSENERKRQELEKKMQAEIQIKEEELNRLKRSRSNLQTKLVGEDLEKWCNQEYQTYAVGAFQNCKWYKDNKAVSDLIEPELTKGDYIFEIYQDENQKPNEKILSICCEVKAIIPNSKKSGKNSDYYNKLNKDKIKKNCDYALLISELEWDSVNDAPIKRISDYKNMYLVRPPYFIIFLGLIVSLAQKYQLLLTAKAKEDITFQTKEEILSTFESFKETYLDKPLLKIEKQAHNIKTEALKASEATNKIISHANDIINNAILELKQKIERFDIKRIANKVNKL